MKAAARGRRGLWHLAGGDRRYFDNAGIVPARSMRPYERTTRQTVDRFAVACGLPELMERYNVASYEMAQNVHKSE